MTKRKATKSHAEQQESRPQIPSSEQEKDPLLLSNSSPLNCPAEAECGACQLLKVPYEKQLEQKQKEILELFLPHIDKTSVIYPIIGMEEPFYYRNKVMSPFVWGKKKGRRENQQVKQKEGRKLQGKNVPEREILCGMYAAHSHHVVSTSACLIENKTANRIIFAIRDLMPCFKLEPYQENSGKGFLRHAIVRIGHSSGEVLVTLVTNAKQFPRSRDFCRALLERCPEITTIVQNVNTRQTNVVLGNSETRLYGPGFILDKLCGLSFRVSSASFYQVNPAQTETLYQRALEMARLSGTETLLDAYCGTGTIGLVAARGLRGQAAARVIGVDDVASAIKDARNNAKHNDIKNASFVVADAGDFFQGLGGSSSDGSGESHVDVVMMDPPRSGASKEFLQALADLLPKRVVYISCNPKTQKRDISYLISRGYQVEAIQPVDMFPHTNHVENIVSLKLR